MSELALGDFTLSRVVESNDPHLPARAVFPDWDSDIVRPHLDWMVPRHLTRDGEKLVVVIQSFLIKTPRHTILVDACGGNHKNRNGSFFHQRRWRWLERLAAESRFRRLHVN